jgi:hypothetical protein
MSLRGGRNCIGAVVALVAVLAMALAAPAGARDWGEERNWTGGLFQHVLVWLGFTQSPGMTLKTDQGSQVDPNGSPKLAKKQGPHIDPNGTSTLAPSASEADQGPHIDPNGNS